MQFISFINHSVKTQLNGLKSIEIQKTCVWNCGKSIMYPRVVALKAKLRVLHLRQIRPKMLEDELLKI